MINWFKKVWSFKPTDLAKHRLHTAKYEDLCM